MFSGEDAFNHVTDDVDDLIPPPPPPLDDLPQAKRLKTEGGSVTTSQASQDAQQGADQVQAALEKILSHISNPKKFKKASPLLRELLGQGVVTKAHSNLLFEALKGAMRDPTLAVDPTQTIEFQKLFTVASKHAELFSMRQKGQLDVFGLWGVLRGQLLTDDSFVYNRVLSRIKDSIQHLPEATEDDDEALLRVKERLQEEANGAGSSGKDTAPQAAAPPAEDPEADPFGLEQIIQKAEAPKRERAAVWSSRESLAMKRDALLDCLDTARSRYGLAWARTSTDIAIQDLHNNRTKFCKSQQPRIDQLWRFVQDQRLRRKQGPSAKEARRDTTSFEAARAEWGKATLSVRGAVGGGGDHRSEVWLG
ncbi:g4055 [Coccomyxa elongata]